MVLYLRNRRRCLHGEYTLKEYKRTRRIRQEYFATYGDYADRHKIKSISTYFRPSLKKNLILDHLPRHDRMGKKPSQATVPLMMCSCVYTPIS
jgi:hypothetical protein